MSNNFNCVECGLTYQTQNGLRKHLNKYHNNLEKELPTEKKYECSKCNKSFNLRQTRWAHEKKCCTKLNLSIEEKVQKLSDEIKEIKSKPTQNIINNTTNNIQYIINAPTSSSTNHLTFEQQTDILDKGLNSLVYLIEMINFNKSVPENHSYCVTAINDKHASVIDEKTNKIIKTDKYDLFDKVLGSNLDNLEKISNNPQIPNAKRTEYKEKILYLRNMVFQNDKFMKRYQNDINIMSYNNKDMIKNTWKCLKEIELARPEPEEYKIKGFDDLVKELEQEKQSQQTNQTTKPVSLTKQKAKLVSLYNSSDSELSSNSDDSDSDDVNPSPVEIKIKNKTYIMEGTNIFLILPGGLKGEFQGVYLNGKIKKPSLKNIEV